MFQEKPPTLEQLFLDNLPLIERASASLCRRHHVSPEMAEEFSSWMKLRLVEDDYAVFRKFSGKSVMKTYLTTVIFNGFKDFRIHCWGRWRPSAEAKRLGPTAVKLEELLTRDGYTFDEACAHLQTNLKVTLSWQELHDLAARLPPKTPRQRPEGEERLVVKPVVEPGPEDLLLERERQEAKDRVMVALNRALLTLSGEDRLIARMRANGVQIAEIARFLKLEQKPLYRRIERIYQELRRALESEGVRWEDVAEIWRGG